jgi:hypothetical protein
MEACAGESLARHDGLDAWLTKLHCLHTVMYFIELESQSLKLGEAFHQMIDECLADLSFVQSEYR